MIGITPSLLIPPLDSSGAVVGTEGTFILPKPVPHTDEVHGQTQAVQEFRDTLAGEWPK